jgi:hypothetical protein
VRKRVLLEHEQVSVEPFFDETDSITHAKP